MLLLWVGYLARSDPEIANLIGLELTLETAPQNRKPQMPSSSSAPFRDAENFFSSRGGGGKIFSWGQEMATVFLPH